MLSVWITGIGSILVAGLLSSVLMLANAGIESRASENCGFNSGYGIDVACAPQPSARSNEDPSPAGPRASRVVMTFVTDPLAVSRP